MMCFQSRNAEVLISGSWAKAGGELNSSRHHLEGGEGVAATTACSTIVTPAHAALFENASE